VPVVAFERLAQWAPTGGARVFWGSTRNFLASWPIETYAETTAIRS